MSNLGCQIESILADAGFSSGENYAKLDSMEIEPFIPVHGGYKPHREGFEYDAESYSYTCSAGQKLDFVHIGKAGGYYKKRYYSRKKVCDHCPKREGCVGKRGFKKIEHTIYRKEYDEMLARLKSDKGKESYGLRMKTVEPVFGTLQHHYGLRWINTRGIDLANKVMLMAACALNLGKLIKKKVETTILWLFGVIRSHGASVYQNFGFEYIKTRGV